MQIDFRLVAVKDETATLLRLLQKNIVRGLKVVGFKIFETARGEIVESPEPSEPGQPPHTRLTRPSGGQAKHAVRRGKNPMGALPRSIAYAVDPLAENVVIGPRAAILGPVGQAHEFGGQFRGRHYEPRPFMGPALQQNLAYIPSGLAGTVTS